MGHQAWKEVAVLGERVFQSWEETDNCFSVAKLGSAMQTAWRSRRCYFMADETFLCVCYFVLIYQHDLLMDIKRCLHCRYLMQVLTLLRCSQDWLPHGSGVTLSSAEHPFNFYRGPFYLEHWRHHRRGLLQWEAPLTGIHAEHDFVDPFTIWNPFMCTESCLKSVCKPVPSALSTGLKTLESSNSLPIQ